MLSLFRKKSKRTVVPIAADKGPWFHAVWVRKMLPDPGAQNYAYETLALAPMTPIGPGIATRRPLFPPMNSPQPYVTQQGVLVGIPTTAGQIYGAPLYNPGVGFSAPNGAYESGSPYPIYPILPAGAAT